MVDKVAGNRTKDNFIVASSDKPSPNKPTVTTKKISVTPNKALLTPYNDFGNSFTEVHRKQSKAAHKKSELFETKKPAPTSAHTKIKQNTSRAVISRTPIVFLTSLPTYLADSKDSISLADTDLKDITYNHNPTKISRSTITVDGQTSESKNLTVTLSHNSSKVNITHDKANNTNTTAMWEGRNSTTKKGTTDAKEDSENGKTKEGKANENSIDETPVVFSKDELRGIFHKVEIVAGFYNRKLRKFGISPVFYFFRLTFS